MQETQKGNGLTETLRSHRVVKYCNFLVFSFHSDVIWISCSTCILYRDMWLRWGGRFTITFKTIGKCSIHQVLWLISVDVNQSLENKNRIWRNRQFLFCKTHLLHGMFNDNYKHFTYFYDNIFWIFRSNLNRETMDDMFGDAFGSSVPAASILKQKMLLNSECERTSLQKCSLNGGLLWKNSESRKTLDKLARLTVIWIRE